MGSEIAKSSDLRGRSADELLTFVKDKSEELFRLRFQHATGQLENVARMKHVRREIARAQTILTEKKRASA
jgi:large subunit ribosomal protein L29